MNVMKNNAITQIHKWGKLGKLFSVLTKTRLLGLSVESHYQLFDQTVLYLYGCRGVGQ